MSGDSLLGKRILIAAACRDMRGADLARALGVTTQAVHAVTSGRTMPTSSRLMKFAEALNVSVEFLMGGDDVSGQIEDILQHIPPRKTGRQLYLESVE